MNVKASGHKTGIVCTIGPSSCNPRILQQMIKSGMDVARLNFSHGTLPEHRRYINLIRKTASRLKRKVDILADLPGPKIRVGKLKPSPLKLKKGAKVVLTTRKVTGTKSLIPVPYKRLTDSVRRGGIIYLNDGFIQLRVMNISGDEVRCKVVIGGRLLSHKGLNIPGAKMYVDAVTPHDLALVDFALGEGVSNFGISFVTSAADIVKVRDFAKRRNKKVYLVAKIERAQAIENLDAILKASDAIMVARGDLGVDIPIEDVAGVQKTIIRKANRAGRPVITATQMLESMVDNIRPTRAEVTDVANAILDGTDAVMLSEESAIGRYPVETVEMMGKIASSIERWTRRNSRR
jgi:pyruvate kinase